ncbi:MAG: 2-C-methyl-D-erythritol 2,4-cyclodiphosphate synthase [Firmicutes bacterium HGW-Firmicutes-13]|nr:MAG: 2-C-methyl-D-erythritol 2,4-cyclodiphosphate synthase [Firmicutes bacterium HGW-Firmicutes-13]
MKLRVGIGYDVHRLVEGRPLILGGIEIPNNKGLLGHSDADVLLHAIMDALLGAVGKGDIGKHFPDNDPDYRGISSLLLLERVMEVVKDQGFAVVNIDSVVMAEKPKLASYIPQMTSKIASVLEVEPSRINIKATTTEGLGFIGRGEGIAAQAAALVTINTMFKS